MSYDDITLDEALKQLNNIENKEIRNKIIKEILNIDDLLIYQSRIEDNDLIKQLNEYLTGQYNELEKIEWIKKIGGDNEYTYNDNKSANQNLIDLKEVLLNNIKHNMQ